MIYLDNAATTSLNKEVLDSYYYLLKNHFANADSTYDIGYKVNNLLETSRKKIASMMHVQPQEILFTSCGSEANSMAIKGVCFAYMHRGKHIITTSIEHASVLESFRQLEEVFGFEVDYLKVNKNGCFDLNELESLIRDDTILVSTMYINNEIGTINNIDRIHKIIQSKNPKTKYHVDMVQALGKHPIDLSLCDLASFSAHKIHGLKGSGFLYKNQSTQISPIISGGQQENGLRGGTENACTHIILAKTLRLALSDTSMYDVGELKKYAVEECKKRNLPINSPEISSPYILNFSVPGYKTEVIVHDLERKGIYISTKSACASNTQISHTLAQLPISEDIAKSALRLSFDKSNTLEEIQVFFEELDKTLQSIKKEG